MKSLEVLSKMIEELIKENVKIHIHGTMVLVKDRDFTDWDVRIIIHNSEVYSSDPRVRVNLPEDAKVKIERITKEGYLVLAIGEDVRVHFYSRKLNITYDYEIVSIE